MTLPTMLALLALFPAQVSPRVQRTDPTPPPERVAPDGAATVREASSDVLRFEKQKLTLRPPLGWQRLPPSVKSAGLLASFAPLNTSGATLSVSYADDPGRSRLPDNLPLTIAAALAQRYPGFVQIGKQRLTLKGADAWVLDGQVRPQSQLGTVRNRQVYVCQQGRIYILTLTAKKEDFDRLVPSFERVLKSLDWLP